MIIVNRKQLISRAFELTELTDSLRLIK